ncbi:AraC family transcriptional regulator [Pirellulales bacterium]|nr:AraC family transcriptional regulator [Pirellulales bacterium]
MSHFSRESFAQRFLSRVANSYRFELFDVLPDVQYFVKDARGRYVEVNQALKSNYLMSGDDEIIGKTDHELFPHHLADSYVADDRQVLQGKVIRNRVELVGHYDGTASWSITTKVPLETKNGQIIGLAGITRDVGKTSSTVSEFQELQTATAYIEENFSNEISVEKLAEVAGFSPRSLQRKFQSAFRISPTQYVRRVRINKASNLLVSSDLTISAIAASTGFADQSHLSREFARSVGATPKEFRKRYYHGHVAQSNASPIKD